MTLRSRLAITLVAVVAVVLAAAGTAVYVFLRSDLNHQLDEQLNRLRGPAVALLINPRRTDPDGARGPGVFDLSNAYVELRDPSGNVAAGGQFLRAGEVALAKPDLPASLTAKDATYHLEVGSTGTGEAVRYRVAVTPVAGGGGLVVTALPTTERDQQLHRLLLGELAGALAVLLVVGVLARLLAGAQLHPLLAMEDAADEIARSGDLSRRVPPAPVGTEVGRLSTAFNGMLDEIESAFQAKERSEEQLRRFVADASHELRTPLTSIRGYSELLDRERDDPDAAARSAARIRSEATRMSRLVDDLLLLARLDEGRPMRDEPVDLAALASAAAADLRAADPSRTVTVDAPDHVVTTGDHDRLAQVLANLLGNARVHTPPGTPVEVRVRAEGAQAVMDVVDHGGGISPEARTRAFERFWRADASRSREHGGSGLGLSIVAAVVAALHGTVEVVDTPGGGATFRVRLPLRVAEPRATAPLPPPVPSPPAAASPAAPVTA